MKKLFYAFSLIFFLFIAANGVKAEPKEVLDCTYTVSSSRKYVLKVYNDSSTNKLSSEWSKSDDDISGIILPNITPTSATKCSTLYYYHQSSSQVNIEKILESKQAGCTGQSCTQTELTPSTKAINSTTGEDTNDITNKTLMLTCNYNNDIVLKIYDDKTFQMVGGKSECSFSKKTLDKLDCPKLGYVSSNYTCQYTLEADAVKGTSSEIPFNNGTGSSTYTKDYGEYHSTMDGKEFQDLVCQMYGYLKNSSSYNNSLSSGLIDFSSCNYNYTVDSSELKYQISNAASKVTSYCNEVYSDYDSYKDNDEQYTSRLNECTNFATFYDNLVSGGVVNDARTEGCGFISSDLGQKIRWVFNLIKIAGPVMAIVLGMLDFVKVIVNNDADKEMKTAWKRLLYRLIAAALLFIIPVLLAWMMDIVLKGTDYNSANPFCGMNEWSEKD